MSFHKIANSSYTKNRKSILDYLEDENQLIKCGGCTNRFKRSIIQIHHIIKRSATIYMYAYIPNLFPMCPDCHGKTEGTIEIQKELLCYDYFEEQNTALNEDLKAFLSEVGKPDEDDLLKFWGLKV